MSIRLADITDEPTTIEERLDAVWLNGVLGGDHPTEYRAGSEHLVHAVVQRAGLDILVQADCLLKLRTECSGCLVPFDIDIPLSFRLTFKPRPKELQPQTEEVELTTEELDEAFYEGEVLDLTTILREQILLALPMYPRCSDICRGLCPVCGADLNTNACSCDRSGVDPPLQMLKTLIPK